MNGVTIITKDIYLKVINKKATDKQALTASRVSVIIVVAVGIFSALWLPILVPLWALAQAIVIAGLFATTMSAWFWKRATTAGAMASTLGGAIAALAWAMYAWATTGSPGTLIGGFHAAHIGLFVSIPLMIVVSLCTKPDYEKAALTNWKDLGEEMKASSLIPEYDKPQRGGFFGWLCADTAGWKAFWVVVAVIFAAHYVLSLGFQVETIGVAMIWVALTVGVLMIFMMAILGGRDLIGMAKDNSKAIKAQKSSQI
jgi:MFS family permease